jgi:energy-coupling factor transporter transmembrane protein EcfT
MKSLPQYLRGLTSTMARRPKVRKGVFAVVAIFIFLQVYFVRELLAAELLFGLGFAVLLALGGIFYLVGVVGERGFDLAEVGVRAVAQSARRGYGTLEELSRKQFGHTGSESAQ